MTLGLLIKRRAALAMFALLALAGFGSAASGQNVSTKLGTVRAWGYNNFGQLGDGTGFNRYTPVQTSSLASFVSVALGGQHSLALKSDGTVWAWGINGAGQLGDGTTTNRSTPVQVSSLTGVVWIAAGSDHSLAVKSDGTVWAWGYNANGQLGDGTTTTRTAPVQVSGLTGATMVAAGYKHSLAAKSDGTAWAWGSNDRGQLGNLTYDDSSTPVQVRGDSGFGVLEFVASVAAGGNQSFAIQSNKTPLSWGANYNGQLGDGSLDDYPFPLYSFDIVGAVAIAAGGGHTLALLDDGTVWATGLNSHGQLGDGTTTDSLTFHQISGLTGVTAIAAGNDHSLARKSDGTVWAWGYNGLGQLGDGTTTDRYSPVQVSGLTGVNAIATGSASAHSLAVVRSPRLDVYDASGAPGQIVTFTARLRSRPSGSSLSGKTITFKVDGTSVGTGATNTDGFAQYAYLIPGSLATGSRTLSADFAGDGDAEAATVSGTLTVSAANTTLTSLGTPAGKPGQTIALRTRLRRAGDLAGVSGQTITFKQEGVTLGTATTDATGVASFNYVIPDNLPAGSYGLTAEFAANSPYNASSTTGTLSVTKANTALPTPAVSGTVGSTVSLTAVLKGQGGNRVVGKTVKFFVGGVYAGQATTDSSGVATFSYSAGSSAGTAKIKTVFDGDASYNASTGGADLTLTP